MLAIPFYCLMNYHIEAVLIRNGLYFCVFLQKVFYIES